MAVGRRWLTSCGCGLGFEFAVTASWSIAGLLRDLTSRGRHPAVIAFEVDDGQTWDSATVADKALRLARGLRDSGVGVGNRVALWAPNSPVWIVTALAVLMAGGVVVPIDDLADAEQLSAALVSSAAHAIEDRAAADLLIVPPMQHIDLLDWTSFDRAIETGYTATMQALEKARSLPVGARIFVG